VNRAIVVGLGIVGALLGMAAYVMNSGWLGTGPPPAVATDAPKPAATAPKEPASEDRNAGHAGPTFGFALPDERRPLPALRFLDGSERTVGLSDFRGRFVLLNVWATWCGPCREEMPSLDRLQAMLGGPDFVVVPLSIDLDGLAAVRDFYAELGLEELGIYLDEHHMAVPSLGVIGIPTTLLVDPQGREIGRKAGPAEWDSPEVVAAIRRHLPEATTGNREPDAPARVRQAASPLAGR